MLARLKSEIAYARGMLRALSRLKRVTASPTRTIGDYLERWAGEHADRPALIGQAESLTYRELEARANRYARWALARGLGKGDAVCLMMSNRPEFVAIWLGFARVGVATALINTNLTVLFARPLRRHPPPPGGSIVERPRRERNGPARRSHLASDPALLRPPWRRDGRREPPIDEEVARRSAPPRRSPRRNAPR